MYIENNKIRLDRIDERLKEQEQKLKNLLVEKELMCQLEDELNNSIRDLQETQRIAGFVSDSKKTWKVK